MHLTPNRAGTAREPRPFSVARDLSRPKFLHVSWLSVNRPNTCEKYFFREYALKLRSAEGSAPGSPCYFIHGRGRVRWSLTVSRGQGRQTRPSNQMSVSAWRVNCRMRHNALHCSSRVSHVLSSDVCLEMYLVSSRLSCAGAKGFLFGNLYTEQKHLYIIKYNDYWSFYSLSGLFNIVYNSNEKFMFIVLKLRKYIIVNNNFNFMREVLYL